MTNTYDDNNVKKQSLHLLQQYHSIITVYNNIIIDKLDNSDVNNNHKATASIMMAKDRIESFIFPFKIQKNIFQSLKLSHIQIKQKKKLMALKQLKLRSKIDAVFFK